MDGMCARRDRDSLERAISFDPYSVPYHPIRQKMNDLFEGEEEFVLLPPLPPPSSAVPFVHEGWNDVEQPAPLPESPPTPFSVLRQAIRSKILALQAARAPSSKIGRLARMLSALRQRWMRLKGGVLRAVGAVTGGRRKRVAAVDCESVNSDHQAKRGRLDNGNGDSTEEGDLEDGNDEIVDVPTPDFEGFAEEGYGVPEDRAATDVILAADFDVDAADIDPEEPIFEEAQVDVDEALNLPPAVEMEVDEEPIAMAAPVIEAEVEAPVVQAVQPAPVRQRLPRRAKAPVKPAKAKAPPTKKCAPKRKGGRRPRQDPLQVLETARGRGFKLERRFDGTARLTGSFPGVDCNKSSLLHKAAHGGVTITAPPRSRITQVAAGANFVMLLTNKGRLMMLGNNAHGQLGCRGRAPRKARVASQSLGWMQRGPIGMASIKIESIKAVGHAAFAWDSANQAYRCGAARGWSTPIMEKCRRAVASDP